MGYSNVWSTMTPNGAVDPAAGTDDDIRKLRLDIQERMDTILGAGAWEAEDIVDVEQERNQYLHWSAFFIFTSGGTWTISAQGIRNGTTAVYALYAPFLLPRGAKVTELTLIGDAGSPGGLVATLEYLDATTGSPTATVVATATIGADSGQKIETVELSHVIDTTAANYKYYYVKVADNSNNGDPTVFHGVRIGYKTTSFLQSV